MGFSLYKANAFEVVYPACLLRPQAFVGALIGMGQLADRSADAISFESKADGLQCGVWPSRARACALRAPGGARLAKRAVPSPTTRSLLLWGVGIYPPTPYQGGVASTASLFGEM